MNGNIKLLKDLAIMGVEKEHHELVLNSQEYLTLKQVLTPPTVEEVCEALSEFHSNKNYVSKFYYDNENKKFYNECIIMHKSGGLTRNIYLTNDGVVLGVDGLTLDLITLIGRFYGGIDKNE